MNNPGPKCGFCKCCARNFSDERPPSGGNPNVCVPCFTGVELESTQPTPAAVNYPHGRWDARPKEGKERAA